MIATLVECCKLSGVNVQTYLEDVLTRLVNGHPQAQLAGLTPWKWAPPAAS